MLTQLFQTDHFNIFTNKGDFLAASEDGHFKMFSKHGGQFTMIFTQFALTCLEVATGHHCRFERP